MSKLPENPKELLRVLNKLGSKKELCDYFNVTRSGLYSYERRNNIKISIKHEWVINDKKEN
jgi:hypothetical protein